MGLITGGSFLKLGLSIWVMHVLKINIRHNANLINKDESTMKTKNVDFQFPLKTFYLCDTLILVVNVFII